MAANLFRFNKYGDTEIKREYNKGKTKRPTINEHIEATECRLIGANGEQVGIVSVAEALIMAEAAKLDLVQIAADAEPVFCKIMDYGKGGVGSKKTESSC